MSIRLMLSASVVALALSAAAVPGYAASGNTDTSDQCPKGQVRDKETKQCVPAARGAVDDDSFYETGRALAYAGRYGEAIEMLSLVSDKSDPRVLNMLGYSHRKAGRIQVGLGYYEEALRADPDFTLAREYMGEAYLTLGDIDAAKNQLVEIAKRCGKGCAEYAELERQITAASKG